MLERIVEAKRDIAESIFLKRKIQDSVNVLGIDKKKIPTIEKEIKIIAEKLCEFSINYPNSSKRFEASGNYLGVFEPKQGKFLKGDVVLLIWNNTYSHFSFPPTDDYWDPIPMITEPALIELAVVRDDRNAREIRVEKVKIAEVPFRTNALVIEKGIAKRERRWVYRNSPVVHPILP